jgi:hypothetical protein
LQLEDIKTNEKKKNLHLEKMKSNAKRKRVNRLAPSQK